MRKAYDWLTSNTSRVLVIGDLHCPFDLDGYLEHCQDIYSRHNCNRVVFIGDIIDNHYSSYHETDPDGFGGGKSWREPYTTSHDGARHSLTLMSS